MISIPDDVRGLVFDIDGTLIDTMPLHCRAWAATGERYGFVFPEELVYELAGMPSLGIVDAVNERYGLRLSHAECTEFKRQQFLRFLPEARPIEQVVAVVRTYAGRLPMAAATGATRGGCGLMLDLLGVRELFSAEVTSEDVANGKPAPDTFLEAARRIGVPPEACLAFEDADLGLAAARAAGMRVVDVREHLECPC